MFHSLMFEKDVLISYPYFMSIMTDAKVTQLKDFERCRNATGFACSSFPYGIKLCGRIRWTVFALYLSPFNITEQAVFQGLLMCA